MSDRTVVELFVDLLQSQTELPPLTEHGMKSFQRDVRTALPFLPAAAVYAQWSDWSDGPIADARAAIEANQLQAHPSDDPDFIETVQLEATYIVGLLVGLGLAHTLRVNGGVL